MVLVVVVEVVEVVEVVVAAAEAEVSSVLIPRAQTTYLQLRK